MEGVCRFSEVFHINFFKRISQNFRDVSDFTDQSFFICAAAFLYCFMFFKKFSELTLNAIFI